MSVSTHSRGLLLLFTSLITFSILICTSYASITLPSGIIAWSNLTINNAQSSPVLANTPIMVTSATPESPRNSLSTTTLVAQAIGGVPPYTYQWYSTLTCNNIIQGQTGNTLAIPGPTGTTYSVLVSDAATNTLCEGYNI